MNAQLLENAAAVLDCMAEGRAPDRALLLCGAVALELLCGTKPDRDLLDAALGLRILVEGRRLDLDTAGRERASFLAALVRSHAAA